MSSFTKLTIPVFMILISSVKAFILKGILVTPKEYWLVVENTHLIEIFLWIALLYSIDYFFKARPSNKVAIKPKLYLLSCLSATVAMFFVK